jgi:hypothetical protein
VVGSDQFSPFQKIGAFMTQKRRPRAGSNRDSLAKTDEGTKHSTQTVVVGLFNDWNQASRAIHDLKAAIFSGEDIGIAMRDRNKQGQLVEEQGTEAAEGATSGAVGGGMLGALAGYLIGIGALVLPGIGPVLAGGALASAFGLAGGTAIAGAGIGAAAGGFMGMLVGFGFPEPEARHFEKGLRSGGILVMVKAGDRTEEARVILKRNGADLGPTYDEATAKSRQNAEYLI